jgi:hypothetical protein
MEMNFMVSGTDSKEFPSMDIIRNVQKISVAGNTVRLFGSYEGLTVFTELSPKAMHRLGDLYSAIISSEKAGAINLSREILENGSEEMIKDIYRRTIV